MSFADQDEGSDDQVSATGTVLRKNRPLIVVALLLYGSLTLLYLFAVPTGESPDEPGHLQCIEQVALRGRLPRVDPKPTGDWWKPGVILSGRMCYHMPLYYLTAGYAQRFIAIATGTPATFEFPPHNGQFGTTPAMFVHEDKVHFWQLPEPPILVGLRLLSMLLGLVTLAAAYQLSRHLFPRYAGAAPLAMVLIAGWPQFVYMSRSINNDLLATALASGLLMLLLQTGRPGRLIVAALLAGLATMTKLTMSFTIVVVAAVWLIELIVYTPLRRRYVAVLPVMATIWLLFLTMLIRNPILNENLAISRRYAGRVADGVGTLEYWRSLLMLTLDSGWARLGWMNVTLPPWHAYLWWGIMAIAIGSGVVAWIRQTNGRRQQLAMMVATLWLAGMIVTYLRINTTWFQPQFRFLFGTLPILASLAGGGIMRPLVRYGKESTVAIVLVTAVIMLGINLWIIFGLLGSAYRWY